MKRILFAAASLFLALAARADTFGDDLFKFGTENGEVDLRALVARHCTVSLEARKGTPALKAVYAFNQQNPFLRIVPPQGSWDLSGFTGVQAEITNAGTGRARVFVRVDNAGNYKDTPWNIEGAWIAEGETAIIKVTFGTSFGGGGAKPSFALDPSKVIAVNIFVNSNGTSDTILIQNVKPFRAEIVTE